MPLRPWRSARCPRPNSATWSRLSRASRERLSNSVASREGGRVDRSTHGDGLPTSAPPAAAPPSSSTASGATGAAPSRWRRLRPPHRRAAPLPGDESTITRRYVTGSHGRSRRSVWEGRTKGVFGLRPYQPSARRVSQPAALPERLVVIRPRDAGLGVVGHGDGRRRPRCTRTCGWGRRSTPPMPATRRSRRRKSSRRRGPRLTGAREDGAFKGPTWPRSFTSPRRSVTAEGSGRITPRRAPGRGRRSGRRRPRCRRHSGRASP